MWIVNSRSLGSCDVSLARTDPAEFVLRLGAGVHEGLRDDMQRGVHHLRRVHVEDEVRVPQDVHPEPQRQAEEADTLRLRRDSIG